MKNNNGFLKTLKELEDIMEESVSVPFVKNKLMIDGDRLKEMIEELRLSLPIEMREAQSVLDHREKLLERAEEESTAMVERAKKTSETMLSKARKNAATIIADAKEEAARLIDEQAILSIAKERAEGIVDRAKNDSVKMRNVTVTYIEGIVNDTYKSLERALSAVEQLKETYGDDSKEEK